MYEWDFFHAERVKFMDYERARQIEQIMKVVRSQRQAFDELRKDNRHLFYMAIQV